MGVEVVEVSLLVSKCSGKKQEQKRLLCVCLCSLC